MNPNIDALMPYPFQRLASLFAESNPPAELSHIRLSLGEPAHPAPQIVRHELQAHLDELARYPLTKGTGALREAMAAWLRRRFDLNRDDMTADSHVIPVNGTREALFAIAQCIVDSKHDPVVMMPNPFYQIYEGAAILAGARPVYVNTPADNDYLPDLDSVPDRDWERCQLFYACSPGNPTGCVYPDSLWAQLLQYADRYDFVVVSDECYSEIFFDNIPPQGLLGYCQKTGRNDYARCLAFHSLSKRSNLPGLRSGFVAGDAVIIEKFLHYRTYHGCAMPPPVQAASIVAWNDESHVEENRRLYQQKFDAVLPILSPHIPVEQPEAGFYLWPEVPGGNSETFTRALYESANVAVLPGTYLSRDTGSGNPGKSHVRMALVAPVDECVDAARRIAAFCRDYRP